jgi:hypothetical protein
MLDNESMKMIENVGQKRASMMLQQQTRIVTSYYVTICTFAIAHTSSASIYKRVISTYQSCICLYVFPAITINHIYAHALTICINAMLMLMYVLSLCSKHLRADYANA